MSDETVSPKLPVNARLADAEARRWVSQMETYLARLDDRQRSDSAVAFSEYLVEIGQCGSALTLCRQVRAASEKSVPPEDGGEIMLSLAGILASEQKLPEAHYVASLLSRQRRDRGGVAVSEYEGAFYMIATSQAVNGGFDGAEKTARELEDLNPTYAALLRCRIARVQASLGFYDEAAARLETVKDSQAAACRKNSFEEIECYRAAKTKNPIYSRERGVEAYLGRLRRFAAVFSDPAVKTDSLDEQERVVSSLEEPVRRASQWRQIAWQHWEAGNVERCRIAVRKSQEAILAIPEPLKFFGAVEGALLSDLCFALGDQQTARSLAQLAADASNADGIGHGLGTFTTGPLVVSVLVRAGAVPEAFAIVKRQSSSGPATMWLTLGAMCAFCNQLDDLEEQMDLAVDLDAGARTALCLGAAYGLCQK
ncbi:MAG: hypothetical protein ACYC6Y_24145 [Thermoguttaceae bacterium]